MTKITNLSDVIPPMESIPCPDCGNHVTISPHPNSHFIDGMDDCLYHGQCRNIACQNCSKKKKVFLICIACQATNNNRSFNGSTTNVTKSIKTATKHAKSQQQMSSMKYWKKILIQEEQQQSSIRDSSFDSDEMIEPSFLEQSKNNSIPETKLPGWNLTSLNELKYHGFDPDSNAPAFYWSEHQLSGSGVRNLTAKAFSLHTEQVSNAEAWFSLTISNLLIQLTKSQRELFAQCMLHAANSKHPQLSIFGHTCVPTSEDDFQKFYLSGPNAVVPNLPHLIPKTTADGTHSFVGLTDLLANELVKATTFEKFYFESNVQFLPKDVTTLSTTPSAYKLYLDLKEDDDDQYVLYLWYKEWSDDFDPNNTKASQNQVWSNTFKICPPKGQSKGRNSYFMSLSCKGEDHSEIEMEFQKALNALSNEGKMFYHGGLKHIIKVKMGKLLLCVDRPERTSILQVGDHNGTFRHFGDIVVTLMDTAKKTTYHPAKNVRSTVYTRLFLENTMNLMRQIYVSCR